MRKRILSIIQYVLFLGGGIFLVWWQLKSMTTAEKEEFYAAFLNTNYWLMIPVVGMSLLSHLSRSMRWKLMMEPLGYNPALKNVFAVTMVGYLANSAIPRLGEVLKCSLLARYEKLQIDKLFGIILVERTFDLVCYVVFIGLTVLMQVNLIGEYVSGKLSLMTQAKGFPIWAKLLLVVILFAGMIFLLRYLSKRFPQNRFLIKLNFFLRGVAAGFTTIRSLKKRKLFLAHTFFIWAMYLLQIYVGFYAMEGTAHLSIQAAFAVLSLATLAMIVTPGGIGSFPIFVMETLLIYSIASPLGKAFGWLIWGANTSIVIIAGLFALLLLPYFNKQKKEPVLQKAEG
ncbi:MAG: flippase-like domain-containing protein [Gloeobacteraceae cyanobacterium ES-bin-316]|nr:flippase-like domain-containing protein [Ferruginibacter sp.]